MPILSTIMEISSSSDDYTPRSKRFQELPAEVRELIYYYLFRDQVVQVHDPHTNPARKSTLDNSSRAIFLTSKTVYREACEIFLRQVVFVVGIECDRHKKYNALDYLRKVPLMNDFRRIWCHVASLAGVLEVRERSRVEQNSMNELKELRVSYTRRTLKNLLNRSLKDRDRTESLCINEAADVKSISIPCPISKVYATPCSYPGETYTKGLFRHECEVMTIGKGKTQISSSSLPFVEQAMVEKRVYQVLRLETKLPIVFEETACSACALSRQ